VLVPLSVDGAAGETVVVRPVTSRRAMTATPVELPPALLDELRARILPLEGVGALALDVTSKPPGTIEWE
jgi:GMP synthase (glutamine-hydrolysing)